MLALQLLEGGNLLQEAGYRLLLLGEEAGDSPPLLSEEMDMALRTAGTAATTTLSALRFDGGNVYTNASNLFSTVDIATFNNAIKDDSITSGVTGSSSFAERPLTNSGLLIVPNRGFLQLKVGDFVAYDTQTGWPILISARAAAAAGWVHS